MTDNQPPPEHKPLKPKQSSFVSAILEWLGSVIAEEACPDSTSLTHIHEFSTFTERQSKIVQRAQLIADDLEEVKGRLISEFGPRSATFIAKCIDPMTSHMNGLINEIAAPRSSNGNFDDFLNTAIQWVKYYSGLDETKLRYKIVQDAHALVEQSIKKDIDVLINYKNQAVEENRGSVLNQDKLESVLHPILAELEKIGSTRLNTADLHEFFLWKTEVDDKRNTLIEMGLVVIDSSVNEALHPKKRKK